MQTHYYSYLKRPTTGFSRDPERDAKNINKVIWYKNNLPDKFEWYLKADYKTGELFASKKRLDYFHSHTVPVTEETLEQLTGKVIKAETKSFNLGVYSRDDKSKLEKMCKDLVDTYNCIQASDIEIKNMFNKVG